MIFVTVGTHEQPFNRLVECVDNLKKEGLIGEDVVIQTGYSTYEPQFCKWKKMYSYQEMLELVNSARIVITHGGPSSFIMPLQVGKTPVVVPRQYKFNEHVNDHQVKFALEVEKRMRSIITVLELERLVDVLGDYDEIVKEMNGEQASNNVKFCKELGEIVNKMFEENK